MLTLLVGLPGFAASAVPDIRSLLPERTDRKHELAVPNRHMKQMRLGHNRRLEAIEFNADIEESKPIYTHDTPVGGWVDSPGASVRMLITYAFFILLASVKGSGPLSADRDREPADRRGTSAHLGRRDPGVVCRGDELPVRQPHALETPRAALRPCVVSPAVVSR